MHTLFVFSAHVAMGNFLPTLTPSAAPYVIMASFKNKSADLLNVMNKNRTLAVLHDGPLLSNPRILKSFFKQIFVTSDVKSLAQVVKCFICVKWFIGCNFSLDDGAESKIGTHKELFAFNILKYKYCVNQSRDISRDHFTEILKFLLDWWPV